jgi:hypothetical protein
MISLQVPEHLARSLCAKPEHDSCRHVTEVFYEDQTRSRRPRCTRCGSPELKAGGQFTFLPQLRSGILTSAVLKGSLRARVTPRVNDDGRAQRDIPDATAPYRKT